MKKTCLSLLALVISCSVLNFPVYAAVNESGDSVENIPVVYLLEDSSFEVSEEDLPAELRDSDNSDDFSLQHTRAGTTNLYNYGDSYSGSVVMSVASNPLTPVFNVSLAGTDGLKFTPTNISGNNTISTKIYYKIVTWTEGTQITKWYTFANSFSTFIVDGLSSNVSQVYFEFDKSKTEATQFNYTIEKVKVY